MIDCLESFMKEETLDGDESPVSRRPLSTAAVNF